MEKELFRFNPWWENDLSTLDILETRDDFSQLLASFNNKQLVFLTGLRRIGKTSLLKLCIRHLIKEKEVIPEHCLYVSMDDFLLQHHSILDIVEAYRKIHRLKISQKIYLFFDEITHKEDFELQLKNLYDLGNTKVFASSSSASLLNGKKAYLTGRSITIEVLPLTFSEYLKFKNITIKKSDEHLNETYFKDFLTTGGIPEYVLTGNDAYIRELMDNIIYKDIAALNGIRQIGLLKDFFLLLMERSGKTMSINKLAKVLHISTETAKRYFELFCDTYTVHPVSRFGKLNEQLVSPKKIYACDTGIRTYYTGERDWGSLFENYVYLRIKHLNPQYIYSNTIEIDFYTENKWLIECKFHNETLSQKQQELFDIQKAKEKYIVRNENDINGLLLKS